MFHAGTAAENERRRAEYMHDLNMRAELDDRVLQAVKLNKRTGQSTVPLTDMRTLDEKMADLQKLKATVRLDLLTITDPSNATEILGKLSTHNLQFVAQKFPLMSAEIKPKYQLGITATQFFLFLRKYAEVEAAAPVSGRPVGVVDLAAALRAIPVRRDVEEVVRLGAAYGLPDAVILALEGYAAAAPVAPLPADLLLANPSTRRWTCCARCRRCCVRHGRARRRYGTCCGAANRREAGGDSFGAGSGRPQCT